MEMSVQEGTFHINGVQVDGIKKLELKKSKDDLNDGIYTKLDNFKASGIFKDIKIAFVNIKKIFTQIWDGAKKALFKIYSNNKEFRKLMTIYNRTKKKRTKKKYYNKMIRFITKSLKQ